MTSWNDKGTYILGLIQWMFIEDQQLDNSMDSLSEKMCKKMSTKQAGSLYLRHKCENSRRMLAEGKTETTIQLPRALCKLCTKKV